MNFDPTFYRNAYADVNIRFVNLLQHYKTIGIKENRLSNKKQFDKLYPMFNIHVYREKNPDICKFTAEQLMSHFHHYGKFECRQYK